MLAAPMAGSDMRRRIAQRVMGIEHQAEETLAHAKSEVEATAAHGAAAVKDAVKSTYTATEEAIRNGGNHIKVAEKVPGPDPSMS